MKSSMVFEHLLTLRQAGNLITPFQRKVQEKGVEINGDAEMSTEGLKAVRSVRQRRVMEVERHKNVRMSRNMTPDYTQPDDEVNTFVLYFPKDGELAYRFRESSCFMRTQRG